jgi:hydrogenase nickel incorporation protein HypA/HybF
VVGKAAGHRVERIELRVGYLRQVVPDSMLFSWEVLTQGTDLEGCELVIDHVPAVVTCRSCEQRTRLSMPILMCGSCESSDVTLVEGDELLVASIDRRPEGS